MVDKQTLGLLSLALTTVGFASYIPSILRRETKPHIFSWVVWAVVVGIAFFAQLSKGAGAGAWTTGYSAFLCLVVAVLSFKHGEKNITRSDWIAFIGAWLAIPVWQITHDPLWAVVIVTFIDLMAYYPTVRKAYRNPFEENYVVYVMDTLKWIPALFALDHYSATTVIFQFFALAENSSVALMIVLCRRYLKKRQGLS